MKTNISKLTKLLVTAAMPLTGMLMADSTSVQVGVGYRQDSIDWTIEEPGSLNPHAKSNLHFKDLEIFVIGGQVKSQLGCSGYARLSFDYGWLFDGRLRHSLEVKNIREDEVFGHNGTHQEGEYLQVAIHNDVKSNSFVWDLNLALGYPIHCWCEEFTFAPTIGFSYSRQYIRSKEHFGLLDGLSTSDFESFDLSSGDSSSSEVTEASSSSSSNRRHHSNKFRTSWWGPWIGFDVAYVSCDCWTLYGEFELHFGRARREKNTRTGVTYFDDYDRTKSFWGPLFRVGANYIFCENWYADTSVSYQKFISNAHRDDLYWSSATIRVDVGYLF